MHHTSHENYYEILGVSPTDPRHTIKAAYRSLVLQFHPDKSGNQEIPLFFPIQRAWETLRCASQKAKYDAFLDQKSRILIYDTVDLQEMNCTNDDLFSFPCRCGGLYEVCGEDRDSIPICIPCSDCSLYLEVNFT